MICHVLHLILLLFLRCSETHSQDARLKKKNKLVPKPYFWRLCACCRPCCHRAYTSSHLNSVKLGGMCACVRTSSEAENQERPLTERDRSECVRGADWNLPVGCGTDWEWKVPHNCSWIMLKAARCQNFEFKMCEFTWTCGRHTCWCFLLFMCSTCRRKKICSFRASSRPRVRV